ncbi:hypothetical protein K435DRAFT_839952 [Dendrothele bispora CBS 962.96]|uniref:DUF6534 domain-containing protein n=1 Tax=Dendrothele bispora (strain CBS 962.96) TaxID=1314807 RepID=A0A4S8LXA7_DENBC|nr:hypothetical protein K435DRAFT_839952 [Dendrothele bispora CBS 962.96]
MTSELGTVAELVAGPFFIGWLFNAFLLGLFFVQCYLYVRNYRKDPLWIKLYVAFLFIANMANTVFLAIWLYNAVVMNFGNIDALMIADWVFATGAVMTGIIVSYVQLFFAWRVKVLTQNVLLALLTAIPSVLGFVASLVSSLYVKKFPHIVDFDNFKVWIVLWLVSGTFSDLMITSVLVTYLRRNKQGFRDSDEMIDRIIRLTVQSGLTTSIVAVLDVVLFLVYPNSALHLVFNLPLNKIYSIMLMSSLNSRQGWAYTINTQSGSGFNPNRDQIDFQTASGFVSGTQGQSTPAGFSGGVRVIETHEMMDRFDNTTVQGRDLDLSHYRSDHHEDEFEVKTRESV